MKNIEWNYALHTYDRLTVNSFLSTPKNNSTSAELLHYIAICNKEGSLVFEKFILFFANEFC